MALLVVFYSKDINMVCYDHFDEQNSLCDLELFQCLVNALLRNSVNVLEVSVFDNTV